MKFFRCLHDADGVHSDPQKVYIVYTLSPNQPQFLNFRSSWVWQCTSASSYPVSPFRKTAPLCVLLMKDTDTTWNIIYDDPFKHIKDAIISDTSLQYFFIAWANAHQTSSPPCPQPNRLAESSMMAVKLALQTCKYRRCQSKYNSPST